MQPQLDPDAYPPDPDELDRQRWEDDGGRPAPELMRTRITGRQAWFEYHCYEGHDSADAEAWYRSHQRVEIVHRLPADEVDEDEVGPMFYVRFPDGLEYSVFEDELLTNPSEYSRPDPPEAA